MSPEFTAATEHLADIKNRTGNFSAACFNTATSCKDLPQAMEFKASKYLPKDALGLLDFSGLAASDARLLAAVFEMDSPVKD